MPKDVGWRPPSASCPSIFRSPDVSSTIRKKSGKPSLTVPAKRWRKAGRTMPVLILTARGSWPERVEGIDAGADDYLPKPFQMPELIARVRGLIRRSAGHASAVLEAGPISVDTRQMRVSVDARTITLTPLEFRLVSFLVHNKGRVVTPVELLDHLYGDEDSRETNALEALVIRTRKKLGPNSIETRRGFGYFIADGEW